MRPGHPSLTTRWVAAQRIRLERTRPSTPGGDVAAERRFYRSLAGGVSVPLGRAAALARRTQVIDAEVARALGHGTAQIVLLGASDDGRALRFGGGAVRWFEVDRPQAQADKRHRLGALGISTPATTYVGLDLRLTTRMRRRPGIRSITSVLPCRRQGTTLPRPRCSSPRGSSTR